jgi:hypothetical protein
MIGAEKKESRFPLRTRNPQKAPGSSEAREVFRFIRRISGDDLAADGGAGGLRLACSCHLSPARAGQLAFAEGGKMKWCIRQDLNLQPSDPKSEALSN